MTGWRIVAACGLMLLSLCVQPAMAQADDARNAATGRWQEQAYGMSLDIPADST